MFEQELLTAISKVELSSPSDGNNTTTNNNTENSFSRKGSDAELIGRVGSFNVRYPQYKTINANTNMRGSFLSPNPFARSITRSPNKSPLSQYYKVKSQAPFGKGTSNEFIPKYQNPNNNMEIKVNYYTRSGAVRDCKIIVIDDCHTLLPPRCSQRSISLWMKSSQHSHSSQWSCNQSFQQSLQ